MFGNELDLCFVCEFPPEHCDEERRQCAHAMAVRGSGSKYIRHRTTEIQRTVGIPEPIDKTLRWGPSNYGEER